MKNHQKRFLHHTFPDNSNLDPLNSLLEYERRQEIINRIDGWSIIKYV